MDDRDSIDAVLAFWFAELDAAGMCSRAQRQLWFNPPAGTDEAIAQRFAGTVAAALGNRLTAWADTPRGLTALVILLDQFTRNIHRNSPAAFGGDPQALALARLAVREGWHTELPTIYRVFLCMPFEHAEDLQAQDEGLACFDVLLRECPDSARSTVADFRRYLVAHREVIQRFGRFPHRNAILGRSSTPEELAYLEKHGGF